MGIEKLEREGFLLPEEARGKIPLESTIDKPLFLLTGALGWGSCILAWWGDGGRWTWIGLGGFFVALYAFTWLAARAIRKQARRVGEFLGSED